MTTIQSKLLNLLIDFDKICEKEGIKYYLCRETAWSACMNHAFFPDSNQVSVAMMAADALKFIEAVKNDNRADRVVDSMYSNKKYPTFTISYADANTTLVSLPDYKSSVLPVLAITIHIIRYKSKKANKFYNPTSAAWRLCANPLKSASGTAKRVISVGGRVFKSIFGGKYLSRALFKKWISLYKNKTSKIYIGDANKLKDGKTEFPESILAGQSKITFEGYEFNTFSDVEEYLNIEYKGSYKDCVPEFIKFPESMLFLSDIPYKESVRMLKSYNTMSIRLKRLKHTLTLVQLSTCSGTIKGYYSVVKRTERRFELYEKYMPMKDQIIQLNREKRYDELNELLEPFKTALYEFYRKGLGLCFDKEIFDITMKMLEMEGENNYAKKLRDLVPEEYWKPITITDYKGEPIEC